MACLGAISSRSTPIRENRSDDGTTLCFAYKTCHRPPSCARAFDARLHGVLLGVDDLRDHRHRNSGELGLSETQFGLLIGTPILTGSLVRFALGIWTDRSGGRVVFAGVMFTAAIATVPADLRLRLPDLSAGRARDRCCRWLVRQRCRLCLALVSQGAAGHGARRLRHGQCRRGGDHASRADR